MAEVVGRARSMNGRVVTVQIRGKSGPISWERMFRWRCQSPWISGAPGCDPVVMYLREELKVNNGMEGDCEENQP